MSSKEEPTRQGEEAALRERFTEVTRLFNELRQLAPEERASALAELTEADAPLAEDVQHLLDNADVGDLTGRLGAGIVEAASAMAEDVETPRRVGHFILDEELGRGGMGVVYRAHDTRLDRKVALKALPEAIGADPELLTRLEHEAKLLASLNHPNVATVFGLDVEAEWPHFILEHVEGTSLAERLVAQRPSVDEALETCVQVASGVEAAHAQGILHRDIKPGNVMVTPDGSVKVLDFGIAKVLDHAAAPRAASGEAGDWSALDDVVRGTLGYMSPEHARGEELDERTDVWSLGCLIYECLTGKRGFSRDEADVDIEAMFAQEPDWSALPEETPESVRKLLRACLHREMARRPANGGEVRWALDAALTESRQAGGRGPSSRVLIAAALATALLVLTLGLGLRPSPELSIDTQLMVEHHLPSGEFGPAAWSEELVLEAGDGLFLTGTRVSLDATLQVFLLSPDGSVALLHPADGTGSGEVFEAGTEYRLPQRGVWRLDDARGVETLFVVATESRTPESLAVLDMAGRAAQEAAPMVLARKLRGAAPAESRSAQTDREGAVTAVLGEHFERVQVFRVRHGQ